MDSKGMLMGAAAGLASAAAYYFVGLGGEATVKGQAVASLLEENKQLRSEIESVRDVLTRLEHDQHGLVKSDESKDASLQATDDEGRTLCIVVVGASGDLAKKKTYPALFMLFCKGLLPEEFIVAGYARSKMDDAKFKGRISQFFSKDYASRKEEFLNKCFYHSGQYNSVEDFASLDERVSAAEAQLLGGNSKGANRVFYLAIPPTVFVTCSRAFQPSAMSKTGWNRIIVEKPFGHDLESSNKLGADLAMLFAEHQLYRIDHYLGKEMVQNLMILRFSNTVFEPLWNNKHVSSVQITFKENFGTKGRGGYFDEFGIIRDVMQNHLMQIVTLVAMEPPISLCAEDVRDEKVKLLRVIPPIKMEDIVIGQYMEDPEGKETSYLDDPTVPEGSITPTFACAVLWINNSRWKGVPFILKCGKALDQRKAEVRIQFKQPDNCLFVDTAPNELVMRVQPDEAIYMKMTGKKPGLEGGREMMELDLSYHDRFAKDNEKLDLPDAYERLIYDVTRGDHNLFVRSDELVAAWEIFTPILHQLDREKVVPTLYEFGGRGPPASDAMISDLGYKRTTGYNWRTRKDPL